MAKNGGKNRGGGEKGKWANGRLANRRPTGDSLHPETKRSVWAVVLVGLAAILVLAYLEKAGPVGDLLHIVFNALLGIGYLILPISLFGVAIILITSDRQRLAGMTTLGASLFLLSLLGLIDILAEHKGGWLGWIFGSLAMPFGKTAAIIIVVGIFIVAILISVNVPLKLNLRWQRKEKAPTITGVAKEEPKEAIEESDEEVEEPEGKITGESIEVAGSAPGKSKETRKVVRVAIKDYIPPPLSLLNSGTEKPTTGDLRANANIIKRTLESFGIQVEMNEINIGPTVTRYTLKPAEGVKLSRITALSPDLALALAAHPIRIEAPIPGKSLVGIEVPNKAAALVRVGSLMNYPEFQNGPALGFVLGRDVNGEPIFADIDRMPHLLIAGATGSGKTIALQSLLISLLYKNSPSSLKLILIDPKRVELSVYAGLPHLATPVLTESKKAVNVFRWAIQEMERRYDLLLEAGRRDIQGYNKSNPKTPLPYLLIVVDELADLMTSYGREVEGSVIRLAQMARATGLHLILSTQRPSVEVITGLIKANITSRVALQVASQIDSRTILDTSGAEKLLGNGDLLFISSEFSKPKRIQGAYITEEEIRKVIDFIIEKNPVEEGEEISFANGDVSAAPQDFSEYPEDEEDELYNDAVEVVSSAKKASASLLQRRLSVGYARAARLLDLMEMRGVIGPGEGAKPREVFLDELEKKRQKYS